jgi:hypothetical protein
VAERRHAFVCGLRGRLEQRDVLQRLVLAVMFGQREDGE